MIIVTDLLCKSMSHEKVNSGFIYGLNLAFPGESIRFYAEPAHIKAIKNILAHDEIEIENIEYYPIMASQYGMFFNVVMQFFVVLKIFGELLKFDLDKVFFLSFSAETLYVIKLLKRIGKFSHLKFTFVLHGGFESIADDVASCKTITLPISEIPRTKSSLREKIKGTKFRDFPIKIYHKIRMKIPGFSWSKYIAKFISVKKMMEWNHSSDYKYISLSPHILKNARTYIDLNETDFYSVYLPTNFVKPLSAPVNKYPKFAIFGYGDSLVLYNIAYLLAKRNTVKPYEIRVIGMDNRGTESFSNVTCTSNGQRLAREEMERQAIDIDAFLILYDKKKYRLSCSGSIFESLSMMKPVIHFDNDCINEFNTVEAPIGFCCYSLEEYVDKLVDVIENYDSYQADFSKFRENILKLRKHCAIESSVSEIQKSFAWE